MAGKKSSKKELFLQNLFEKACDLTESKVEGDREKGLHLLQALKKKKNAPAKFRLVLNTPVTSKGIAPFDCSPNLIAEAGPRYCSQGCQEKDWPLHKTMCKKGEGKKEKIEEKAAVAKGLPLDKDFMPNLEVLQLMFPGCEIYYKVQSCGRTSHFLLVLTFGKEYPIARLTLSEDDDAATGTLFKRGLSNHKQLYLASLRVHRLLRRKGVGERLMHFSYYIALKRKRGLRYIWHLRGGICKDAEASKASIFHAKVLDRLGLPFDGNSVAFPFEFLLKNISSSLDLQPKPFSDEEKTSFCSGEDVFDQVLDMKMRLPGLQLYDASESRD